jgi:hypothetical protein
VGPAHQYRRKPTPWLSAKSAFFKILVDSEPAERGVRSSVSPRAGPLALGEECMFVILVDSEPPERGARSSLSPRAVPRGSRRRVHFFFNFSRQWAPLISFAESPRSWPSAKGVSFLPHPATNTRCQPKQSNTEPRPTAQPRPDPPPPSRAMSHPNLKTNSNA